MLLERDLSTRRDAFAHLHVAPAVALQRSDEDRVFRRVYACVTETLRALIQPVRQTLARIGCAPNGSFALFEYTMEQVRRSIVMAENGPLAKISSASGKDPRPAMLREVLRSFGVADGRADQIAERWLTGFEGRRTPGARLTNHPTNRELVWSMFAEGCATERRLEALRRQSYAPFRGRPTDADAGVEQSLDLIAVFPDLAPAIYAEVGLAGLRGFPPALGPKANEDARLFADAADRWARKRRREEALHTIGLIIAGVAITAISFGTFSGFTAMLVAGGFNVALGAAEVVNQQGAYQTARAGYLIGATSAASFADREAALQGAQKRLVIDVVTGGALARFSLASQLGRMAQFLRVELVNAAGTALATASDPAVMRSENAAGIILFTTTLGVITDGATDTIAGRLAARLHMGARLQVGIGDAEGPVQVGRTVQVATDGDPEPVRATVIRSDPSTNVLELSLDDGSRVTVRVDRTGRIELGAATAVDTIASRWKSAHARYGGRNPVVDAAAKADVRVIGRRTLGEAEYLEVEFGPNAPLLRVQDPAELDLPEVHRYVASLERSGWVPALLEQPPLALPNGDAYVLKNGHHRDAAVTLLQARGMPIRMRALVGPPNLQSLISNLEKAARNYRGS
jgi:hypothetical protein